MNQHCHTLLNGITGMIAAAGSFAVTFMQEIEAWLRLSTSFLGLIIALITIYNLLKGKKRNGQSDPDE